MDDDEGLPVPLPLPLPLPWPPADDEDEDEVDVEEEDIVVTPELSAEEVITPWGTPGTAVSLIGVLVPTFW